MYGQQCGVPKGDPVALKVVYQASATAKAVEHTVATHSETPLSSILPLYAQAAGIAEAFVDHFKFDGDKLDLTRTPAFFDMEDDDLIDVVLTKGSTLGAPVPEGKRIKVSRTVDPDSAQNKL